jgi:hypothetical protein
MAVPNDGLIAIVVDSSFIITYKTTNIPCAERRVKASTKIAILNYGIGIASLGTVGCHHPSTFFG